MLVAYKHDEEHILREVVPEEAEKGSWLHTVNPTEAELKQLSEITGIPSIELRGALDPEERSHVELEDEYVFIVINTPVLRETLDSYDTLPLGIYVTERYLITVCLEYSGVISIFLNNQYATFRTYKKTRFLFQIMNRTATLFLQALQQINRRTDVIEAEVRASMQNKEFFQLLELQKSLTYFTSALKANGIVMEKLLRLRNNVQPRPLLKMYEEDEDLLEDVIIDNKQAIEMVEMYSLILINMMDAFASIISNNLNMVMKFLASITILLAVPTLVFSLWGINTGVPWEGEMIGFTAVTGIAVFATVVAAVTLWRRNFF
ncbi:MAG: magnesium transporter CorA family protein [Veillonellaceae bacterium]|nr:magnesium transporter CorA family protein [Veillonellaceae bacterium]